MVTGKYVINDSTDSNLYCNEKSKYKTQLVALTIGIVNLFDQLSKHFSNIFRPSFMAHKFPFRHLRYFVSEYI